MASSHQMMNTHYQPGSLRHSHSPIADTVAPHQTVYDVSQVAAHPLPTSSALSDSAPTTSRKRKGSATDSAIDMGPGPTRKFQKVKPDSHQEEQKQNTMSHAIQSESEEKVVPCTPSEEVGIVHDIIDECWSYYKVQWADGHHATWVDKKRMSKSAKTAISAWRKQHKYKNAKANSVAEAEIEYAVKGIIGETDTQFLVDWEDEPLSGKTWRPTLEPKHYVDGSAVLEWREAHPHEVQSVQDSINTAGIADAKRAVSRAA